MKHIFRFLVAVVLGLLLVACGGNSEPEKVEFTIEMSEFSYSPDSIQMMVGQTVTLNLVNVGQIEHEVMFGREVMMDKALPSGFELDLFEHAGIQPSVAMEMHMEEHEEAEHDEDEHAEEAEHGEDEHAEEAEHDEDEHAEEAEHGEDEHAEEAEHEEAEHDDDEAEHADDMTEHGHSGFMVALKNEDTATMTFTVTEEMVGTWEIGCFLQSGSHHLAGMKGSLEVDA